VGGLLRQLMGRFKHFHQERVDGRVTYQLEEEQMLQALQANRTQCWQPEEELGKPGRVEKGKKGSSFRL